MHDFTVQLIIVQIGIHQLYQHWKNIREFFEDLVPVNHFSGGYVVERPYAVDGVTDECTVFDFFSQNLYDFRADHPVYFSLASQSQIDQNL